MGFAGMRPTAASLASPSCLVVYEHVTRGRRRRVVDARYTYNIEALIFTQPMPMLFAVQSE